VENLATPPAGPLLFSHHNFYPSAYRRRTAVSDGGRRRADVTIDPHSRGLLGINRAQLSRTFAAVSTPQTVQLWANGSQESGSIEQTKFTQVEATPALWSCNGVNSIALELEGARETVFLDVGGPWFDALPATKAQQESVVEALGPSDRTL